MLWLFLLLTAIVILCIVIEVSNRRWLKKSGQLPVLKGYLPVVGHTHQFLRSGGESLWETFQYCSRETEQQGGVLSMWLGPIPIVFITDPVEALHVLNTCLNKMYVYDFTNDWIGGGLSARVSEWKRVRKHNNPAFSQQNLVSFMNIFNRQAMLLVKDMDKHVETGAFDPNNILTRNSLETICQTALGRSAEGESLVTEEYATAFEKTLAFITVRVTKVWLHFDFIYKWTKDYKDQRTAIEIMHKVSSKAMKERRAYKKLRQEVTKGQKCIPFIDLLLQDSNGVFSDTEIKYQINTIIFGGHDTTAKSLFILFHVLGSHMEVQEKVFNELEEVFGDSNRDVYKEDLTRLVYLEAVIKEMLRLYPVAPIVARNIDNDIKIRNYTIPSGTAAVISLGGINRSACWGADADQFKPERWLNTDSLPKNAAAFASFSLGRRNCPGKVYAMMSLKTTLAHVFRHYRVTGDHTKLRFSFDLTLKAVAGQLIAIERRRKL